MAWRIGGIFFAIFWGLSGAQAGLKFSVDVSPKVVGVGQTFELSVEVSSDGENLNVTEPHLPRIEGLKLIGQRQESQSIRRFDNGEFKIIQSRRFVFTYMAMTAGAYTISPIRVQVNGGEKTLSSGSIHVSENAQPNLSPPPKDDEDSFFPQDDDGFFQMDRMEEMFNQMLRRRGDPFLQNPPNDDGDSQGFFIEAQIDKTKAYVGEQIIASWYLYTRGQVRDIDTLKYPDLKGFWKEDIEIATRLNFEQVMLNGIPYNRALLVSFALYPLKAGPATIDPYTAKCTVITGNGLGLFGMSRPQVLTRSSPAIQIEVLPIPQENRPQDFSGATGLFDMFASIDATSFKTNQPFFYRLRFEGKGNAKVIEIPKFAVPDGLQLYDQKSTSGFEKNGTSRKEFELTFVPRKAGEINIPKISLSFFNPQTKTFYRKETESIPIHVELAKDETSAAPQKMEDTQAPIAIVLPEIVREYKAPIPWDRYFNFYTWVVSYGFAALLLLGKAGRELGWWERKETLESKYRARVKKIYGHISSGHWRQSGQEIINTIYFVLGEVTGLGGASYELQKLLEEAPPSVRRELAEPLKKLLQEAEVLGYAPEAIVGAHKEKTNLKRLAAEMEKILERAIRLYQ